MNPFLCLFLQMVHRIPRLSFGNARINSSSAGSLLQFSKGFYLNWLVRLRLLLPGIHSFLPMPLDRRPIFESYVHNCIIFTVTLPRLKPMLGTSASHERMRLPSFHPLRNSLNSHHLRSIEVVVDGEADVVGAEPVLRFLLILMAVVISPQMGLLLPLRMLPQLSVIIAMAMVI
ncbi:hypothetical protein F0562_017481 [Nyssa sinensis]|uniref:Uncharacterized protein n=1 Tax=Nyssa sinensis TaxID=561372 RepID=A0A5J4ZI60_9ASTE|nr:hypothetical protein F0562_017481 [Nyssa sinensis]